MTLMLNEEVRILQNRYAPHAVGLIGRVTFIAKRAGQSDIVGVDFGEHLWFEETDLERGRSRTIWETL